MAKLYLIPTPVGNLEDITLRALRILKEVPLVLAEDTRTSAKLLKHYEINTPLLSHHKFNEHQQVNRIAERIARGEDVALISDAGTPGIFGENRHACVAREISKLFEDFQRGTLKELINHFTENGVKGEIVMIVEGKPKKEEEESE